MFNNSIKDMTFIDQFNVVIKLDVKGTYWLTASTLKDIEGVRGFVAQIKEQSSNV